MARSDITGQQIDLQSDDGAVLWSIIQGEQLSYQITFDWLTDVSPFTFEAVITEAANDGSGELPTLARVGGVATQLVVVKPASLGNWVANTVYNTGDIVTYSGLKYQKITIGSIANAINPATNTTDWGVYVENKILLRLPSTLSTTPAWATLPTPNLPVFGFFELAMTETGQSFNRTWKPMRGAIQINYSPTQLVV